MLSLTLYFTFESIMFLYSNLNSIVNFREIINEKFKNEDDETLMHLLILEELMNLHIKNSKINSNKFFTKDINIQKLLTHSLLILCFENKEKLISILNKQKTILENKMEKEYVPEERMMLLLKYTNFIYNFNRTIKLLKDFNILKNIENEPNKAYWKIYNENPIFVLEFPYENPYKNVDLSNNNNWLSNWINDLFVLPFKKRSQNGFVEMSLSEYKKL
jgi:hypothetical protein